MKKYLYLSLLLISFLFLSNAQPPGGTYDLNDWITFKNGNMPTSIAQGKDYIYFGTTGGIIPFNRNGRYLTEPYTESDGLADDQITAVLYDETTNYIWAAHKKGVSYLTPTGNQWQNITLTDQIPENNPVNRLGISRNFIWATAPGGFIFKIDKSSGSLIGQFDSGELNKDIRWGITKNDPLPEISNYFIKSNDYRLDGQQNLIGPEFRKFKISIFFTNSRQNAYGGAWQLGLLIGEENIKTLDIMNFGPLNNQITSLAQTKNSLIMASNSPYRQGERNGITFFQPQDLAWNYIEPKYIMEFPTNKIFEIAYSDGKVWYGTDQGIIVQDRENNNYNRISVFDGLPGDIIHTIALEDSIAWIGSKRGLGLIDRETHSVEQVYLTSNRIKMEIFKIEPGKNKIWIGTDNGLYSVDKKSLEVNHFDDQGQSLGRNQATPISFPAIATNDSLMIAYGFNNFAKYNIEKDQWSRISDIPDVEHIYEIALSREHLWVGTDNGAHLIELDSNYKKHYTYRDGLAGRNVFQVLLRGDNVWFGTEQGLTKFYWTKYVFQK